jgi:hypothetical protein
VSEFDDAAAEANRVVDEILREHADRDPEPKCPACKLCSEHYLRWGPERRQLRKYGALVWVLILGGFLAVPGFLRGLIFLGLGREGKEWEGLAWSLGIPLGLLFAFLVYFWAELGDAPPPRGVPGKFTALVERFDRIDRANEALGLFLTYLVFYLALPAAGLGLLAVVLVGACR